MTRAASPLELWGGVECSVVRIGDDFRNQLVDTGHQSRFADLDAMAALGVTTVRYPILWETIAPETPGELDFSWHDKRLAHLRKLGIKVVAGLVHHGSGPRYTNLLDPRFPDLLADFAAKVARRYPWIEMWNPVNEPFTTARFSCLYGHWYPHLTDIDATFAAVVNQCLAIKRAIEAIRQVIPDARLVPTEDVGKTFATEPLQYQADHENERRWLTYDLLAGRVVPGHDFYDWLCKVASAEALDELATGAGTPDVIGFDHYLTSERYLDHRVERFPDVAPGSNGRDAYVDVEAVRVARLSRQLGPRLRLGETWERYRIPIAITEVHHGCTRDEQVRWLHQVWTEAEAARGDGVDVRAVTMWAMFGMVDWRSLLTRREGDYDVGGFDTRGATPRPTLLAKTGAKLARGETVDHPVLDLPGWWRRPGRTHARPRYHMLPAGPARHARPLLISGATGTLGQAFAYICGHRGLPHVLTSRAELDIADEASIAAALDRHRPWAVINTAGFVRTWEAEQKADECFRANVAGPELLAKACKAHGIPLVTFSSDLVFDGQLGRSYVEPDRTAPSCEYGRSKAEAEQRLLAIDGDALIVRTSAFFGPWDRHNFLFHTVEKLRRGEDVFASDSTIVSPTYVPDLVHATLDLLLDEEKGIWHLTNQGAISWHELAREIADRAKLDPQRIILPDDAPASDTSLTSSRGLLLRPLGGALDDFAQDSRAFRDLSA